MSAPQWVKYLPQQADGKVARVWLVFIAVAGSCVAVNAVLLIRTDPHLGAQFGWGVLGLLGALGLVSVTGRVDKLERALKTTPPQSTGPGPFQKMIEDAKAAARAAGHDERQVNSVAQEVLTTCIRQNGGWKA